MYLLLQLIQKILVAINNHHQFRSELGTRKKKLRSSQIRGVRNPLLTMAFYKKKNESFEHEEFIENI